ncbi:hypothetical protein [Arsukibacterium indicum]|uniref:DNA pilot protein n=1 Tax=Arsukibacterium indicum TaxID=2848612 RepID=A0ABS6MIU0_9GAMM|nr:hypothetical protein [Arsukibacterium indicum]MBV2128147.1 hypothetical protein [Arsukibacterium indicum]
MSLLLGFGRGLQQASGMLAAGMQEDRAVKRAEEIERMREASFERRWQRDAQRQDQMRAEDREFRSSERAEDRALRSGERAEDMAFRQSESNRQAGQFDRQMSVREQQVIENNLAGVMDQQLKAETAIQKKYEKLGEMGASDELQNQMAAEIKEVRDYYGGEVHRMVQSYGPERLKGTSYEYLLTVKPEPNGGDGDNTSAGSGNTDTNAPPKRDLSGFVSDIIQPLQTIDPLANAANARTGRLEQSNQRQQQVLQQGLLSLTPAQVEQANARISGNEAEIQRIRQLQQNWEANKPTNTFMPQKQDWRQDPYYLARKNTFR